MININKIPRQIHCANCKKELNGTGIQITDDGNIGQSITLCAECLEKAAQLRRENENTKQIVYTVTRTQINTFQSNTLTKVFYNKDKAIKAYQELFEIDIETLSETERKFIKRTYLENLKHENYKYQIINKHDKIITEATINLIY